MKHLVNSWIARAVLSLALVAATVSALYGEDKVVRIGSASPTRSLSLGPIPKALTVSDLQRKQGS